MTREELIVALKQIKEGTYMCVPSWSEGEPEAIGNSKETQHVEADALLCKYINDPEIEAAYHDVPKWYA